MSNLLPFERNNHQVVQRRGLPHVKDMKILMILDKATTTAMVIDIGTLKIPSIPLIQPPKRDGENTPKIAFLQR
jgi:hypothetical protein